METIEKLKTLKGVYHRSIWGRAYYYSWAVACAIGGGLIVGDSRYEYVRKTALNVSPDFQFVTIGLVLGSAIISLGFIFLTRADLRYEFENGTVRAKSSTGRMLWAGNLSEVTKLSTWSGRAGSFFVLHFGKKKRYVERFPSLELSINSFC